jgi:surfactin synthase thioesterase subunit
MRIYCFPHSGGAAGEYVRWSDHLPGAEVWGVQLPGRGRRIAEPPHTTMAELVRAVVGEIDFARPYVLLGHSLGALVAYETALELRRRGRPGPAAVVVSGYEAPHLHRPGDALHELDAGALLDAIDAAHGTVPAEVRADPELSELMVGGLRADLAIVASYQPAAADPLPCPLVVLGGLDDEHPRAALAAWKSCTTDRFELRMFAGDHFYFREHPDDVLRFLADTVAELADRADQRPSPMGAPGRLP